VATAEWYIEQFRIRGRQLRRYATGGAAARAQVRREWFFVAAARFTPVIAVDSELGRVFVSTSDRVIGPETFAQGGYDNTAMTGVLAELERRRPGWQSSGIIAEVGANIGTTSLLLAQYGPVIAFEPIAENATLLRQNVVANNLQNRVTVREVAVSDTTGTVTMEFAHSNSGDHRVRVKDTEGSVGEQDRATVDVPVARLDDLIGDQQLSLLWVDVQGHEAQVLAGASRLLATGVPTVIEYWPYGLRRADGLELLERLVAEHFSTIVDTSRGTAAEGRVLDGSALSQLSAQYPGTWDYTDLLLLP
jgi:FkbM family methyltransferase